MIKAVEEIPLGTGQMMFAEYDEDSAETGEYNNMQTFGMMKDVKVTVEREFETIEDDTGGGMAEVKRIAKREKGTVEFVLGEDIPEERIVQLGAGTVETVAKQEGVSVERTVVLSGIGWEILRISKKANPDLTFTVGSNSLSPADYSSLETLPYVLGEQEGSWAIRRKKTSVIPDGSEVVVSASNVTIPGHKKFSFGGVNTSKSWYMEHWKKKDDGDINITKLKKVGSPGKAVFNNPSESWGNDTLSAGLQVDLTQEAGKRILEKCYEDSTIA
ncbi:MAG: hypothetical protein ABRQ38_02075 [Candidatus Eremiobacterota bacterium]